jgi:tetratricopeptide (TPR) repeat protein
MNNLAIVYENQGRYDEAEPLYLTTLETQERVLGDDHPNTLASMNALAGLYRAQGRYDEAEPLYLETLEARKRVLGDDHPDTASTLYGLACLEALRGERGKGIGWLQQAVEAGFKKADQMAEDADLEPLHGPEFDALVERAREKAAAQRGE